MNVQHSREEGDRVLQEIGRLLGETVVRAGQEAVVARVLGDEFGVLLPGADTDVAFRLMEDFRRAVEQFFAAADTGPRITVSVGVASAPRDASGAVDLRRKAENGPWRAKKGNRNRVALPSDERMVLKTTYYATGKLERLSALAARLRTTEASLLRQALDGLLRRFADTPAISR